jgi:putative ABC transport system permease protein
MNVLKHAESAFINIMAAKLRSFLAVLGILVGTASVVALISCGQLGTDLLSISIFQKSGGRLDSSKELISLKQWRQLPEKIPAIRVLAPYAIAYQPLSFDGKSLQGVIIGADENLAKIMHINLKSGHFVSFVETFEHFCVIGDGIANQIKKITQDNPLGKQVRVGEALYTIIGVAAPWAENSFFNENLNQSIITPIAGMALVSARSKINYAVVSLYPETPIDPTVAAITENMKGFNPQLNVFVRSAKQLIAGMESQGRIFTLLLGVIGSISLIVGGIGIMNIMLVSVTERKKEIGLRKAIGARNKDIQALFMIESVFLSIFGGFLGILLGILVTRVIAWFSVWPFSIHWPPIFAGFFISVVIGVFFGFYPAKRAALLEPMVSLRSE